MAKRFFAARRQSDRPSRSVVVDEVEDDSDGDDLGARRAGVCDHRVLEDGLDEHESAVDGRRGVPGARVQPGRIGSEAAQVLQFELQRPTLGFGDEERS